MRIRTAAASASFVVLAAAAAVALAGPVGAQADPCPPGQPTGRPPGTPVGPGAPPGQPVGRPIQYPPGKCQLRLSQSVVAAGASVGVAGDGYAPGAGVRLALASASPRTLGTVTADAGGSFSTEVAIPASTEPGLHELSATGASAAGGTQVLSASLTVTGAGQEAGASLPRTGNAGSLGPLAGVALALVVAGSAAVAATYRRRLQ